MMEFVKKCKRVLRSSKRLHPENNESGSYGRLRNKERQQQQQKNKKNKCGLTPQGCICVYVGPERERFVIKIKIANHPLFKALLDAAEREYGYRNDGPLWLPCHVDLFCEALAEMEGTLDADADADAVASVGCAFSMPSSASS
ncbi:auxin-responsive protein SAUR71 [Cajanus cajan]|uniref:Indole-3-acetic acid-induced protein ARG7 n=1 Tax=Cajanus cajan TaxID=3821 RepID=A0A151RRH6_CAJCA|nr:auxin-responsive protein SAUR71 [Cajanus cajan]KYP45132.1 Indole-3-acetic acid-induced protein ARG7 [Cajanus cajan]